VRRWLLDDGRVAVQSTAPVTLARSGWVADFTVANGYNYSNSQSNNRCATVQCVLLFRTSAEEQVIAAYSGDRNRFYLFPMGNRLLLITISAPADRYAHFADEVQAVLRTVNIGA
jgi:hypothetical protein